MIQGLIVKKVIELVIKRLLKEFKLDKIKKYVEEPNELDRQVKSLQKNIGKYGKYIEQVEKDIAILKKLSHPKADFVCTGCGCKAKRIKKKTKK